MANLQNSSLQHNPRQQELYTVLYVQQVVDGEGRNQAVVVNKGFGEYYGVIAVNDWPMYDGPDVAKLKPVAWLRGHHTQTCVESERWLHTGNIVFEDTSRHPGSTLVVIGTIEKGNPEGELAIVGGTGDFTFAQGVIYFNQIEVYETGNLKRLDIRVLYMPVTKIELKNVFSEFTPSEVEAAINEQNCIGEGGFGDVYKETIRGTLVAVKVLHKRRSTVKNFTREVENIKRVVRHKNLVALLGACREKLALIFEYCPNGTLADRLYPVSGEERVPLSWVERVRVVDSICSGLKVLHEERIVHADIKPNNILFGDQNVCKICDYGLTREVHSASDTTTGVHYTGRMGTTYYMDPELERTGELTVKSDVYALGIIMLQLVTGKFPKGLRYWVSNKLANCTDIEGVCQEVLDPNLNLNDTMKADAVEMVELGLQCSRETRAARPNLTTVRADIKSMKRRAKQQLQQQPSLVDGVIA